MSEKRVARAGEHRRARRGYRMVAHGTQNREDMPMGDFTIKPSADVALIKPKYSADGLIFRPLPCLTDDEDQEYMPYRYSSETLDFTDWIRQYPVVSYMGMDQKEKFTFILYDPTDASYDRRNNPYVVLRSRVWQGIKNASLERAWDKVVGSNTRDCWCKKEESMYFMQGLVFHKGTDSYCTNGEKPLGFRNTDKPQIIRISSYAGDKLIKMMELPNDEWSGSSENYEKAFKYGDIVDINKGRFINVFKLGTFVDSEASGEADWQDESSDSESAARNARSRRGGDEEKHGYDVRIFDHLVVGGIHKPKMTAGLGKHAERLKKKIVFWDDVIYIPSEEEICLYIAKALKGAAKVLEYAWQDHQQFFTDDVLKVLRNATQTFMQGATPGAEDRATEGPAVVERRSRQEFDMSLEDDDLEQSDYDEEMEPEEIEIDAGVASELEDDDSFDSDEEIEEDEEEDEESEEEEEADEEDFYDSEEEEEEESEEPEASAEDGFDQYDYEEGEEEEVEDFEEEEPTAEDGEALWEKTEAAIKQAKKRSAKRDEAAKAPVKKKKAVATKQKAKASTKKKSAAKK